MYSVLSRFECGDMTVIYPLDEVSGRVGLWLVPSSLAGQLVTHRTHLNGVEFESNPVSAPVAWSVESAVQLACRGDDGPPTFGWGRTMRNSASTLQLRYGDLVAGDDGEQLTYGDQDVHDDGRQLTVVTRLRRGDDLVVEHILSYRRGDPALRLHTRIRNSSADPVTLEMLSSFSLGGITPFAPDDAPERLVVHRLRSAWSAEARLVTDAVEELHLEPSWSGIAALSERFGQIGTQPVRGFAPFVGIEDTTAGVLWGAQLAWAGSWQMEIYRKDDLLSISGGLADREFGHWWKSLAPGEVFTTPEAVLTTVRGDIDDLCQRLTAVQQHAADAQPAIEADLPICFNEYCTTWGNPSHAELVTIADRLAGTPVRYLVIDAGWYKNASGNWYATHGDWIPSADLFPDGLAATTAAIRQRGLIPGLWFEAETVGREATAFSLTDHVLHRDGVPITVSNRRFWNMNDATVVDYLSERVIGLLEQCSFGYVKIDYNETIGLGCDGAESPGEGLRRQVEGTLAFFARLRERLPDLVIENCASGGHRLEPLMTANSSVGSFSDAHETVEIPIIAANLHRVILPRQSLIWAVLHRHNTPRRIVYLLAATFLGRMCLSGDITDLTPEQWEWVTRACALYTGVAPIIKRGHSRRLGPELSSYRHPHGWQGMLRTAEDGMSALVVLHAFAAPIPDVASVALPGDRSWRVVDSFTDAGAVEVVDGNLTWQPSGPFSACVVHLTSANA